MGTYTFNCPKCGQILLAERTSTGLSMQCPKCQHLFQAPEPAAAVPVLPAGAGKRPNDAPLAIWSLVLGISSLTCFGILTAIPAVICGHKAQSQIKASGGMLHGAGMALAGLILGYVTIGLSIIMIALCTAIAIPSFMKAQQEARRNTCVVNLRSIDHAKQQLATQSQNMRDSDVPAMSALVPFFKGKGIPVCPDGGVYAVNAITSNPTCSKHDAYSLYPLPDNGL